MKEYLDNVTGILNKIEAEEGEKLSAASDLVADVICNDKLVYIFGCGHSHLVALDTFYRAGGLACVSALLDEDLMLHDGAAKSSRMEKIPGIGAEVYRRHAVKPGDLVIVISASGKNAAPVEVLRSAKAAGVTTIAISSSEYRSHGGVLLDEADVPLDSKVAYGDAVIPVGDAFMGGMSTMAGLFILNSILIEGSRKALERGVNPPIYRSGNVEGGTAKNSELEAKYFDRIKRL